MERKEGWGCGRGGTLARGGGRISWGGFRLARRIWGWGLRTESIKDMVTEPEHGGVYVVRVLSVSVSG